jgi:hypothetical protein
MKASKFTLVKTIVVVSLLIGLSNAASARTGVYVSAGFGYPDFHRGYHPGYRFYNQPRYFGPTWRHYYPYRETIIVSGGYSYDWGPDYYVVTPPVVVERPPVIVERQTVIVQPQQFDESTLQLNINLQYKKSELLKQLQMPNKELRKEAIKELAGFSFDDNVRAALENVLLSDPDPELRKEAAQTFGKVKNTKALPALEKARVEDSSEDVRKEADQSIKKILGN